MDAKIYNLFPGHSSEDLDSYNTPNRDKRSFFNQEMFFKADSHYIFNILNKNKKESGIFKSFFKKLF
jgi:hypothetical protein